MFLFRSQVAEILYTAYMKIWSIVIIIKLRDMVIGYEQERTGCSQSIMNRKEPPTGTSSPHDCNFQVSLTKRWGMRAIFASKLAYFSSLFLFSTSQYVLFCQRKCLILNLGFSVGSFNQGNVSRALNTVIWLYPLAPHASLEVL